jgi:hypothetical protein
MPLAAGCRASHSAEVVRTALKWATSVTVGGLVAAITVHVLPVDEGGLCGPEAERHCSEQ